MLVYLIIEETPIAHEHSATRNPLSKPMLDIGWIYEPEIGMIYCKNNKFHRIETQQELDEIRDELLEGKIIDLNDNSRSRKQARLVKVHIGLEGVPPKRGEYFWNPMCCVQQYHPTYDYGVFDPGKSKYDDKVILRHEEMKDPAKTANEIVGKDVKYMDDRNKFEAEIKDGEVILL